MAGPSWGRGKSRHTILGAILRWKQRNRHRASGGDDRCRSRRAAFAQGDGMGWMCVRVRTVQLPRPRPYVGMYVVGDLEGGLLCSCPCRRVQLPPWPALPLEKHLISRPCRPVRRGFSSRVFPPSRQSVRLSERQFSPPSPGLDPLGGGMGGMAASQQAGVWLQALLGPRRERERASRAVIGAR